MQEEFEISAGKRAIEDGYLIGFMEEDGGGLIYSKKEFSGDVLLDFYAKTVKPYDNDLNFTFCAAGWDYEHNKPLAGYICGLQGLVAWKNRDRKMPV